MKQALLNEMDQKQVLRLLAFIFITQNYTLFKAPFPSSPMADVLSLICFNHFFYILQSDPALQGQTHITRVASPVAVHCHLQKNILTQSSFR